MNSILLRIIESIYVLIPAGFANMAPVLFGKFFSFLAKPIDFGRFYKGTRILGDHKTWRGLIFGILTAIGIVAIQRFLYYHDFFYGISVINYTKISVISLGFLLGFGALFGDMVKSFLKRRIGLKPGKDWWPFDQMDWVFGSSVFLVLVYDLSFRNFLVSIAVYFVLHIIVKELGYFLKLDKKHH
jgi:CDP-2,3-bis-(O-geranylgeranyl)-sn-glycerol synthase